MTYSCLSFAAVSKGWSVWPARRATRDCQTITDRPTGAATAEARLTATAAILHYSGEGVVHSPALIPSTTVSELFWRGCAVGGPGKRGDEELSARRCR